MKTLGSLVLLGAACLLASDADACGQVLVRVRAANVRRVVTQRAVVVAPVAVAAIFPPALFADYRGYSATYGGPDASAALLAELQKLRAEVKALKGSLKPAAVQPETLPPPAGGQVGAFQACAQCHTGEKAKGGLMLLTKDGGNAPLTAEQRLEVLRRIDLDVKDPQHMPPKTELAEGDLAGITAVVLQRKGK